MNLKVSLLIVFGLFTTFFNAQNPELFQSWRLTYMSVELDSDVNVEAITPEITTVLTIFEDFNFEGDSGCNSFSGSFNYDAGNDKFSTEVFNSTLLDCEFPSHVDIEDQFYYYLNEFGAEPMEYVIFESNDGTLNLHINMQVPGFDLQFKKHILSASSVNQNLFYIYPNPVSKTLQISTENSIQSVNLYLINGQKIATYQSKHIDISNLAAGLYFIEVVSNGQKSVQKFIKR